MQQQTVKPLTQDEIWHMKKNGDTRGPNMMRKMVAQGIDPRADSPAFAKQATSTTTTPAPTPAQPAASQSSGPAPLSDHQTQVMRNIFGGQAQAPAQPQGGGDFEAQVNAHQEQHGCRRSESIGAIAAEQPQLYEAWLQSQQPSGAAPAAQTPGQKASEHEFMAQAKRLSAERSIPLSKAMGELSQRDPALHQRFLRDIQ
ncbi:MAG: hypothetical protein U5L00_11350 [Desulfovermiculus sp.]|nr:hypothetical protein [Desulfovermiculus sp.]